MTQKPVPGSVRDKIALLKKLEMDLGVLPPEDWTLTELQKRVFSQDFESRQQNITDRTEDLFAEICEDLDDHGFSAEQIAAAINAELKYEGGPRYCSAEEVKEALGHL